MPEAAVGGARRAGSASARATSPPSCRARRTSSSTCCSRAPSTRSAREIAEAVESVGGEMNAFTAQEHTAFYARLPGDAARRSALDILADVLWRAGVPRPTRSRPSAR